jgi:hypothetical protein
MTRPNKEGLDYFNINIHNDDKLDMIESEFGLIGWAIIMKMWGKIYDDKGYFYEWTDENKWLFKKKINAEMELIERVIQRAIERNLFDKKLFDRYNILTSNGIQKRYFHAIKRRKEIVIIPDYLINSVNDYINSDNVNIIIKNVDNSTQRKEKKRKEKNINTHLYGFYKHIKLTDEQFQNLLDDFGKEKLDIMIKILDEYIQMKGAKYKDYNLVLRGWVLKTVNEKTKKPWEGNISGR